MYVDVGFSKIILGMSFSEILQLRCQMLDYLFILNNMVLNICRKTIVSESRFVNSYSPKL